MTAGSGNSAAGVLTQLNTSEATIIIHPVMNIIIPLVLLFSSTLTSWMSISKARDGDSSSATTTDITSRKDPSSLLSVLQ